MIHETAIIDTKTKISSNVSIGPYTVIGPDVEIGENTIINSHVNIEYFTIRDVKTLQHSYDNDLIALIAGHLGEVRLIDNMIIKSSHNNK